MKNVFPIILTQDNNDWLVYVPDLEINTEGKSIDDAIEMARDAIGLWGTGREDCGKTIPEPATLSPAHKEGEIVALIDIDFEEYRRKNETRTVKKNCTLPAWLNYEAEKANINFSAILQAGLKSALNIQESK